MLRVEPTIDNATRLAWVNAKGELEHEYIPHAYTKIMHWLADRRFYHLALSGKDIYYWHTRYRWDPYMRKKNDIAFILHVLNAHNGEPELPQENKWFIKLWNLYSKELSYMELETAKDSPIAWRKEKLVLGDPYAYAYKHKWIDSTFAVAQSKTLYHGVNFTEYNRINQELKKLFESEIIENQRREKARLKKSVKPKEK